MNLRALIEAKLFLKLAESREDDMEKLHVANETFENIVSFIRKLKNDSETFSNKFYTDSDGTLKGFHLETNLKKQKRTDTIDTFVEFLDHELTGVKQTIRAQAGRVLEPNTGELQQLHIKLYIDAPKGVKKNAKSYNKWFAKNLASILQDPDYRSSFVHEFTHTLDYRRINPKYLIARAERKIAEKEAGVARDRNKYANDPLELNAYFQQAISDFFNSLLQTKTVEEWNAAVGETPQEFAENVLTNYLRPQVIRRLTPDNKKRLMKRAATAWEYLKID